MPLPDAIAGIGFTIAGLNFLSSGVHNLNSLRHSVVDFRRRVDIVRRKVVTCEGDLLTWDREWNYCARNGSLDGVHRYLWGQNYEDIKAAREAVIRDVATLKNHIERVLDVDQSRPKWRQYVALNRKPILRRFAFALCSEMSMQREVAQLREDIRILRELSDRRLKAISGPRLNSGISADLAIRLGNLGNFGKGLFEDMRRAAATSAWSLELYHPELGGDAESWQTLEGVQVWFSFAVAGLAGDVWSRVIVRYMLRERPGPVAWAAGIVDVGAIAADTPANAPANPAPQALNPTMVGNYPLAQKTETLRSLFRQKFFKTKKDRVYKQWEPDQAYLVLGLANWAILLWESDWTPKICCSGLHFSRVAADAEVVGTQSVFLPSLHVPDSHGGRPGEQQPAENDDCTHHQHPKLRNIGLVLAEAICTIPLRAHGVHAGLYEKWDGQWHEIPEQELLHAVQDKSSRKVREAVNFCLQRSGPANTADGIAGFYKEYVENVSEPLKTWCDRLQHSGESFYDAAVRRVLGRHWPDSAFQAALPVAPPLAVPAAVAAVPAGPPVVVPAVVLAG